MTINSFKKKKETKESCVLSVGMVSIIGVFILKYDVLGLPTVHDGVWHGFLMAVFGGLGPLLYQ